MHVNAEHEFRGWTDDHVREIRNIESSMQREVETLQTQANATLRNGEERLAQFQGEVQQSAANVERELSSRATELHRQVDEAERQFHEAEQSLQQAADRSMQAVERHTNELRARGEQAVSDAQSDLDRLVRRWQSLRDGLR
jgi:phage shock protein A